MASRLTSHATENHQSNLSAIGSSGEAEEREKSEQSALEEAKDEAVALKSTRTENGSSSTPNDSQRPVTPTGPLSAPRPSEDQPQGHEDPTPLGGRCYSALLSGNQAARAGHTCAQSGPADIAMDAVQARPTSESQAVIVPDQPDDPESVISILAQLEVGPISNDWLVVEIKATYAKLVIVEAECIEVHQKQAVAAQELTGDQWRSLFALHKRLLHEHHRFFLMSQHSSASDKITKLATKYSMPVRMWRHGIEAFLQVLKHRLPASIDYMLAFHNTAYSTMIRLYETVPTFEDTWVECLGDIGRYGTAIESCDRRVWSNIARYWYEKASAKNPTEGRLYHHLAILATSYQLERISLFAKSLTCVTPFEKARESFIAYFNPNLAAGTFQYDQTSEMETLVIRAHGILFTYPQRPLEEFDEILLQLRNRVFDEFVTSMHQNEKDGLRLKKVGAWLAVSNISGILEYGASTDEGQPRSPIWRDLETKKLRKDEEQAMIEAHIPTTDTPTAINLTWDSMEISHIIISYASKLSFGIFAYSLTDQDWRSKKWTLLLPHVHIMMTFIWGTCTHDLAMSYIGHLIPWKNIATYLNNLTKDGKRVTPNVFKEEFPQVESRPLWEDFILQGMVYTCSYFPKTWFSTTALEDEERQLETPAMDTWRMERVLWLGHRIASLNTWLSYNRKSGIFEAIVASDQTVDERAD